MEIRDVHALLGRTAYAADGDRLGTVSGAYLDSATGRPSWITIERGGPFRGSKRAFVPVEGVEPVDDAVRLPLDADTVRRAPSVEADRVLTRADERELLRHYGLPEPGVDAAAQPQPRAGEAAMTLSEERPRVGTTTVPASRAVLRKTRVVEEHTFSVPLGRDQVQVAYEPLTQAGPAPAAPAAPAAPVEQVDAGERDAGDEGWVVLYEERLVVRTEWVPVERVRLGTVGVQDSEIVHVDLRRERVAVDVDDSTGAPSA